MQELSATAISSVVRDASARGFQGIVHSVFQHTLNIVSDELLITVVEDRVGEIPNGLLVDQTVGQRFDQGGIQPRMRVECDEGGLEIQEAHTSIMLSRARTFPSQRVLPGPVLPTSEWAQYLRIGETIGVTWSPTEGIGPLWHHVDDLIEGRLAVIAPRSPIVDAAAGPIASLIKGFTERDLTLVDDCARSLSGLGIGLTPSGDDVLTGFVAAVTLVSKGWHREAEFQPIIQQIVDSSEGQSNIIARSYLLHASRAEISRSLAEYITAFVSRVGQDVLHVTNQLFDYGGTSGAELGLGAFLALSILNLSS